MLCKGTQLIHLELQILDGNPILWKCNSTMGAIYQYYDVSKSEFDRFMQSPSLGSALSKFDKCHRYKRIL